MTTYEYKDALDYMAALRVLYRRGEDVGVKGKPSKIEPLIEYVSWASGISNIAVLLDLDARTESIQAENVSSEVLVALVHEPKPS